MQFDFRTNTNKGFAFITYVDINSLPKVLEQRSKHYLCNKWVDVKPSCDRLKHSA